MRGEIIMRTDIRQLLPVLALVATVLAGCADTEIQGNVLDEDINSPELMMGVARGVNSEFADLYLASALQYELESPTDGALNDGTAAAEIDRAVGDFRERPQSSLWAQAHEAVWASLFAGRRMLEVLGAEEYAKSPLAARIFVYGGHAERILGGTFCELVYNYGKDGGQMLGEAGPYSNATPVPNDS